MKLGLDLGTTNSLMSYYDGTTWKLIPNEFGSYKTPSVVSFDDDGKYYVGEIALRRKVTHPKSTFSLFKRKMGTDYIYENSGYTAQDLSSILIKHLVQQAENFLEETIEEVIITVPAYFDDVQRHDTKGAGILAGLSVERIINEPSAAALAYYEKYQEEGYHLIFDFGGGTLDISTIDIFDNIVDVLGVSGDTELGGIDIDRSIVRDFRTTFPQLLTLNPDEIKNLELLAESMKINLTDHETATLEYYYNGEKLSKTYDNKMLTDLNVDILAKMRSVIEISLLDAGLTTADLTSLICVGGSSNVLFVRQYLEHLTGLKPRISINPEQVVALGAGIVASIKERVESVKDIILMDVCPFSIGISLVDNAYGVIIPKNSTLPASYEKRFVTVNDYQRYLTVEIYQGDSVQANRNKLIMPKEFLKVKKGLAGEESIWIHLSYDINGILEVKAKTELDEKAFTIVTNPNLDTAFVEKKKKQLSKLKEVDVENPYIEKLLSSADALHRNSSWEMQEIINKRVNEFLQVLQTKKPTSIKRELEEFSKFIDEHSISVFTRDKDETFLN